MIWITFDPDQYGDFMIATSHWSRLIDYLERMGAPLLLHNRVKPSDEPAIFHGIQAPLEYLHFIGTYGYPSLYIDDDLYLGFLSFFQTFLFIF